MSIAGLTQGRTGHHCSTPARSDGPRLRERRSLALAATALAVVVAGPGSPAAAAIVPTVGLGTAGQYAVLAGSTVTNTGNTVLDGSLGLSPGTSITGFPPGLVLAPSIVEQTSPAALQAQTDLTAAFVDAAGRSIDATTPADLVGQVLVGGVYAGPAKSPLSLSGTLVLDGAGDPTSVFIFQTDSTLITAANSTVALVNGAQECNVFWLVGSSATLGTGSSFAGTILALDAITVTNGVTVRGRALARNAAVTLDNDTFTRPTCAIAPGVPATVPGAAATTLAPGVATSVAPGAATTVAPGAATSTSTGPTVVPGGGTTPLGGTGTVVDAVTTTPFVSVTLGADSTSPGNTFPDGTLPRTGAAAARGTGLVGLVAVVLGVLVVRAARRRPVLD